MSIIETTAKAQAYDAMVQKAQMQDAFNKARELGAQEGYAAATVARDAARNWDGGFVNSVERNPIIPPQDARIPDGGFVDSVQENPVILPSGEVISAEQARGLADRAVAKQRALDARVQQSIVPPAATRYPTYKGQ